MKVYCMFEQSGTFKRVFESYGYESYDLDILNEFNETDFVIDLFQEIRNADYGLPSFFDRITKDDLVFAFFPCVRFSPQTVLMFQGKQKQLKNKSDVDKLDYAISLEKDRSDFYFLFCTLFKIALAKGFKLIVENPYNTQSYLVRYFPLQPAIVDTDRTFRGDNFVKPTMYYFVNFEPKWNFIFECLVPEVRTGKDVCHSDKVSRSMISHTYADRFVREFIL